MMEIEPLTRNGFADFGDVIDTAGIDPVVINQGFAQKYAGLAHVDVGLENGTVNISLFNAQPRPTPIAIALMERHPLGSQMFMPLQNKPWLVLVCADPLDPTSFRLFRASGGQGINYARNVWHFPVLVHDEDSRFLVVDRAGPGNNLHEIWLPEPFHLPLTS